jgi:tetratricopeptide (TPR) repeat protein
MMQPATAQSVIGNFAQGTVILHGATYRLSQLNGRYSVTESSLTGKPVQHRVEYTLGTRRIQHYLTTLPDGRIIILPITWDNVRKQWIDDADVGNPEEASGDPVQVWNKTCSSCHVSREQKNFDLERLRYDTKWQNLGVNCESCHGPGSEHVARATQTKALDAKTRVLLRQTIVNLARLDPARSTAVCAQCHSFRDTYAPGYEPGRDFYDFFMPVMQYRLPAEDSAYWADGRPRWLSNEVFGLWQSECFLKGRATCVTCHSNSHDVNVERTPHVRPAANELCAGCHKAIAASATAHSHHAAGSAGSVCVNCHMPPTIVSLGTLMRDHSMSIPVPENTLRHGIPNACNLCHQDKGPQWAAQQMDAWYGGDRSRQKLIRRADAFGAAQKGAPSAIPALLQMLDDRSLDPMIRGNAVGYLGSFPSDPSAYDAVLRAFQDSDPLVRATAASAIRPRAAQREAVAPALASLLDDPVRTVRMSAVIALVAMGASKVPPENQQPFDRAKAEYAARAELYADNAQQQLAAGNFFLLAGDPDAAIAGFRAALKLDPAVPAQYSLALALERKGDFASARKLIAAIPANDRQYDAAQRLLTEIERQEALRGAAPAQAGTEAQKHFLDGEVQYQDGHYGAALTELEQALRLAPQAPWTTKAQIYRAITLEKLARTADAEAAMQQLSSNPDARQNVELQLAWVELLSETARPDDALKRVDALIAAVPSAPMAYFWRGKILLQLHRGDEAAGAAEQSIRLLPDLVAAHNLLLRIYQQQGRAKEAAEQAKWLSDYQRRMQSR